jgi:vanillate O-demethylase ferredoxin subunit
MMEYGLLPVRVARKRDEAADICVLELVSAIEGVLPRFSAGAHIDVHLGSGLSRQYSLCNNPSEQHRYVIGVLREPESRGGSRAIHDSVKEGDILQISEPRNHFALGPVDARTILFAGGIGITPILCMAERLATIGAKFDLHYCGRTRSRMAFMNRIAASSFADRVHFHMDDGDVEQRFDINRILSEATPDSHLYVCGPGGFIEAVANHAKQSGWSSGHIHFEYFAAAVSASDGNAEFDVRIASSGQVIHVNKNETVVAALARLGIEIATSCEQGVCGTCMTRVLEGEPAHRDHYLSDDERAKNDVFLPCCSRSQSKVLVLDL